MVSDGKNGKSSITFESWKDALRKDCERHDKILAFNALGDFVLGLLWERGLDPTVSAIVGEPAERRTAAPLLRRSAEKSFYPRKIQKQ